MLAGGCHIQIVSPLPSPANESRRWPERWPLFWAAVSWLILAAWGWLLFATVVPAGKALIAFIFNLISTVPR